MCHNFLEIIHNIAEKVILLFCADKLKKSM